MHRRWVYLFCLSFFIASVGASHAVSQATTQKECAKFQAYRSENKKTEFKIRVGPRSAKGVLNIVWSSDSIQSMQIQSSLFSQNLNVRGDWTNLGSRADRKRKDIVRCVDVDFDGAPDLLIETSSGSAGQSFRAYVYHKKKRRYFVKKDFEVLDVWNPRFDPKKKRVLSQPSDSKKVTQYRWVNGRLRRAK